jgi:hypothetical protein
MLWPFTPGGKPVEQGLEPFSRFSCAQITCFSASS